LSCTWSGAFGIEDPLNLGTIVDQSETGYDAPGNGQAGEKDGAGNYKVNFPNLNVSEEMARTNEDPSKIAKQGGVIRYSQETVSINLRYGPTRGRGIFGFGGGG
jgi:hypothetical protein